MKSHTFLTFFVLMLSIFNVKEIEANRVVRQYVGGRYGGPNYRPGGYNGRPNVNPGNNIAVSAGLPTGVYSASNGGAKAALNQLNVRPQSVGVGAFSVGGIVGGSGASPGAARPAYAPHYAINTGVRSQLPGFGTKPQQNNKFQGVATISRPGAFKFN